jgi:ABC-type Fe3+ transport system permease subunit
MPTETSGPNTDQRDNVKSSCSTSMKFNFTVGAIAIAVAVVIAYVVHRYLS